MFERSQPMTRERYYVALIAANFPLDQRWDAGQAVIEYLAWLDSLPVAWLS